MDTPYAYALEMPQALQAALVSLRAALAAEQLGIVSTVDVQATLQARLGGVTDRRPAPALPDPHARAAAFRPHPPLPPPTRAVV